MGACAPYIHKQTHAYTHFFIKKIFSLIFLRHTHTLFRSGLPKLRGVSISSCGLLAIDATRNLYAAISNMIIQRGTHYAAVISPISFPIACNPCKRINRIPITLYICSNMHTYRILCGYCVTDALEQTSGDERSILYVISRVKHLLFQPFANYT